MKKFLIVGLLPLPILIIAIPLWKTYGFPVVALILLSFVIGMATGMALILLLDRKAVMHKPKPAMEELQYATFAPCVDVRAEALADEGGFFERRLWHDPFPCDEPNVPDSWRHSHPFARDPENGPVRRSGLPSRPRLAISSASPRDDGSFEPEASPASMTPISSVDTDSA